MSKFCADGLYVREGEGGRIIATAASEKDAMAIAIAMNFSLAMLQETLGMYKEPTSTVYSQLTDGWWAFVKNAGVF